MQHDTSLYQVELAGRRVQLVASLIYLRYSKRRYLKFYRAFDRFRMKCFFHQALMFWGYAARQCIIDNTNLARLRGTGAHAVIRPGDGGLRQAVWLCLPLPRNQALQPKGERFILHFMSTI